MRFLSTFMLCLALPLIACDRGVSGAGEESQMDADKSGEAQVVEAQQQAQPTQISFKMIKAHYQGGPKCSEKVADAAVENQRDAVEDQLCATVSLTYPQMLSEAKPDLVATLNDFILRQLVDSPSAEDAGTEVPSPQQFADGFINEYQQTPNPFNSWELERSISVVFSTAELLTLLFEEYGYTGGAHPYSGQRYSVLSLTEGKPVVLADLLTAGYEVPLNVAGERIFREERKLKSEETLEEQGFSFPNNVFALNDNYGVLKEGLDFIFNSYEIAPYALGPTQFTVPYEDIRELISPQGALGQ